jgi:rhamnosyltransferase
MTKILILLSSYNGDKFIREQLDSIFAQQDVSVHLLVRDDGSKDNTVNILREYKARHSNMTILADSNIGCAASFFTLINYAVDVVCEPFDYYAFCDQDDQWFPCKLKRAAEQLDAVTATYKLYFCSANCVDKDGNYIKEGHWAFCDDYTTSVFRNPALGCTMVFNKPLLQVCSRGKGQQFQLHDAWMWRCANFFDAIIIADREPNINYRQHGNNVTCSNKSLLKRYISAFKRRILKNKGLSSSNIYTFYDLYKNDLSDEKNEFLLAIINYKHSFKNTLKLLRLQKFKGVSSFDRLLWRLIILFRLY